MDLNLNITLTDIDHRAIACHLMCIHRDTPECKPEHQMEAKIKNDKCHKFKPEAIEFKGKFVPWEEDDGHTK